MGLLKLVKNHTESPGIDFHEFRDILYYDKYKYRARISISGVRFTMYTKTIQSFVRLINRSHEYKSYSTIQPKQLEEINKNIDSISNYITYRNDIQKNKLGSIRIEGNRVSVFSNELSVLQRLTELGNIEVDYTEVIMSEFAGVKYFANTPKYNFRVYLKRKRIEPTTIKDFSNVINKTKDLYPSSSLSAWLMATTVGSARFKYYSWQYSHSSATHFIDFNNESTLSYLALMYGEYLGHRYKLEKRIVE